MARTLRTLNSGSAGQQSKPNDSNGGDGANLPANSTADDGLSGEDRRENTVAINPDSAEPAGNQQPASRTRARASKPAGSGSAVDRATRKRENAQKASQNLGLLLHGIHGMLGAIAQTPELKISAEESQKIAAAVVEVQEHFDVAIISPKFAAIGNLAATLAGVYVPRFIGMKARLAAEKKKAASAPKE